MAAAQLVRYSVRHEDMPQTVASTHRSRCRERFGACATAADTAVRRGGGLCQQVRQRQRLLQLLQAPAAQCGVQGGMQLQRGTPAGVTDASSEAVRQVRVKTIALGRQVCIQLGSVPARPRKKTYPGLLVLRRLAQHWRCARARGVAPFKATRSL